MTAAPPKTLVIACGALAREYLAVVALNGWSHLTIACLPAVLHNRPSKIPEAVRAKIQSNRGKYDRILCLYGDCGTGGLLDRVLEEEGVERIAGAHCYEFYAGHEAFTEMTDHDPATFFLTDYLVRHFERLIIKGLAIDRHPELLADYFGNYARVIYLMQTEDSVLLAKAQRAAASLGLPLETRFTGLRGVAAFLEQASVVASSTGRGS